MTYKDDQKVAQEALKPKLIYAQRTPLELGIRKFKKANPGQADLHKIYKENAWKTINH